MYKNYFKISDDLFISDANNITLQSKNGNKNLPTNGSLNLISNNDHQQEKPAGQKVGLVGCRCVYEKIFCPNLNQNIAPNILKRIPKEIEFL